MTVPSNADAIRGWNEVPVENLDTFGDEGDFVRQHLLNPVIFELLSDPSGKAILDAGCG